MADGGADDAVQAILDETEAALEAFAGLELKANMSAAKKKQAADAIEAAGPKIEALATRARALGGDAAANAARDQVALGCVKVGAALSWIEEGSTGTERWLERAAKLAANPALRNKIEEDLESIRLAAQLKDVFDARNAGKVE